MVEQSNGVEVLITVKATPQPSRQYGDTVCVAGVRLDGERPEWVRLYPIDFRWLGEEAQFKKYDVMRFDLIRAKGDSRKESFKPVQGSWAKVRSIGTDDGWKERHSFIDQLPRTTTCELSAAVKKDQAAPSLGLMPVADISELLIEPHPPWTAAQVKKMRDREVRESGALIAAGAIPKALTAPRFIVRYRYRCEFATCNGHTGRVLDWELTALQNRLWKAGDESLKEHIRKKFLDDMWSEKRWTSFFMGNFEDPTKRHNFSVLGVYWPPISTAASPQLF